MDTIEIEWKFEPAGLFEEKTELNCNGSLIAVDGGQATLRVELEGGQPAWESLQNELHEALYAQFLAAQVLSHEPFALARPTYARLREGGGRDIFVTLEGAVVRVQAGRIDAVVTCSGKVIRDNRRERIDRREEFGSSVARHAADPVLNAILRSYMAAVNDPKNELIHLYEIRDALSTHFEGQGPAITALQVSGAAWSTLGRLADNEPIREGRHRGRFAGELRDATDAELADARTIARSLISGYLKHLEDARTG